MNKLNEPLAFHTEELIAEYGLIEIVHNIILWMDKQPQYSPLINSLESIRDAIGNINDENLRAEQPGKLDRPNVETQQGES